MSMLSTRIPQHLYLIISLIVAVVVHGGASAQTVDLRVDGDNGSLPPPFGTADGSAWGSSAFKLLQDALAEAAEHAPVTTVQIWVAATDPSNPYRPDRDAAFPFGTGSRFSTFRLDFNNVQLLGGFPPGGGDLEDRDPALNITVLSGKLTLTACGDPEDGGCFEANGTPGCEDAACCATAFSRFPWVTHTSPG